MGGRWLRLNGGRIALADVRRRGLRGFQIAQSLGMGRKARHHVIACAQRIVFLPRLEFGLDQFKGHLLGEAEFGIARQVILDHGLLSRLPLPFQVEFNEFHDNDLAQRMRRRRQPLVQVGQLLGIPVLLEIVEPAEDFLPIGFAQFLEAGRRYDHRRPLDAE
jgi:hypothetical protein